MRSGIIVAAASSLAALLLPYVGRRSAVANTSVVNSVVGNRGAQVLSQAFFVGNQKT